MTRSLYQAPYFELACALKNALHVTCFGVQEYKVSRLVSQLSFD